ncbi:hypothetical protein YC2023_080880 [Brassica napus]
MVKKAVLIGINYPGTEEELVGCINDVKRMHKSLVELYGFSEENIVELIDTDESKTQPTGKNIRQAFWDLVGSAQPGDVLFVHYSGHGTRLPPKTGEDDDTGYDECIVPSDINYITDDDIKEIVGHVPKGCSFTFVSDSCHSGGLIDSAKEQIGESFNKKSNDDFRDLVDMAPKDCPITIVSDSCHSGGLIDEAKEQIGESTKKKKKESGESSRTNKETGVEETETKEIADLGSRSLPLETLIDMLKQETGKDDIEVGKIRTTLFDMFGEDSSPKVQKFMNVILSNLQETTTGQTSQGDILESVANLTQEFLEQKINDFIEHKLNDNEEYVGRKQEVYAGASNGSIADNGILISGCQTDQTSADASPLGQPELAYGAFTNAVQIILEDSNGKVTYKELVMKARKLLKKQGFTQRPGLYCSDGYVNAPFIC